MSADQVVLDLETQRAFSEVGEKKFADLGVSLVGVYFYATDRYETFEEAEIPLLEEKLSRSGRIIGFNIKRFDFPVLQPYFKRLDLAKLSSFDLLEELEKTLGHRVSLQSVSMATLNVGKGGSGLDAIHYYRAGEMDKLKKYCLEDVRLTKEIYEYGKKLGCVYYQSKDKTTRLSVKVDWKDPEPPANLSLF